MSSAPATKSASCSRETRAEHPPSRRRRAGRRNRCCQPARDWTPATLALLATAGCTQPLVSPRLRVCPFHDRRRNYSAGPDAEARPNPRQQFDFDSRPAANIFRATWSKRICRKISKQAKRQSVSAINLQPSTFDLLLVSGGASVGEKDFTRPLLEWLGFEIVFSQVNVRPGRPLIFGRGCERLARIGLRVAGQSAVAFRLFSFVRRGGAGET